MKKLFLAFLLLFTISISFAGTVSNIGTTLTTTLPLTALELPFDKVETEFIRLFAKPIDGNYGVMIESRTGTHYSVPASKKLVIRLLLLDSDVSTGLGWTVLYGDNDVGEDVVTVPTNPVYLFGSIVNAQIYINKDTSPIKTFLEFEVPTGKFPHMFNKTGGNTTLQIIYATEEDA